MTRQLVAETLNLQWSPEQIAASLPVSHETIYRHVYADKAQGGSLWKHLRCQKKGAIAMQAGRVVAGRSLVGAPLPNIRLLLKHAVKLVTGKATQ